MPRKEPDDSQVLSVRLPADLLQRLDRSLDWRAPQRRLPSTRNTAIREALSAWLDQQEPRAGRLQPHTLRRQFQATYYSADRNSKALFASSGAHPLEPPSALGAGPPAGAPRRQAVHGAAWLGPVLDRRRRMGEGRASGVLWGDGLGKGDWEGLGGEDFKRDCKGSKALQA